MVSVYGSSTYSGSDLISTSTASAEGWLVCGEGRGEVETGVCSVRLVSARTLYLAEAGSSDWSSTHSTLSLSFIICRFYRRFLRDSIVMLLDRSYTKLTMPNGTKVSVLHTLILRTYYIYSGTKLSFFRLLK